MRGNQLDKEYYVMDMDGKNNHPLLSWAETHDALFLSDAPVGELTLKEIGTLNAKFDEPYPPEYEMPDWMILSCTFACTFLLKNIFENNKIYGIEFLPLENITDNYGKKIKGYYVAHIWNRLPAIDKENYTGDVPTREGYIFELEKFSLSTSLLQSIPLERRMIFELKDSPGIIITHEKLHRIITKTKPTGFSFFRIDMWNNKSLYR